MRRESVRARGFTSPPVRVAFNHQVWEIVAEIPKGKVTTYGGIASMIPRPRGVGARHFRAARARWVGQAMAGCPEGLPWHRVINSQGKISARSKNDHHVRQRKLLEEEGVVFDARGKVDLDTVRWNPHSVRAKRSQKKRPSSKLPK